MDLKDKQVHRFSYSFSIRRVYATYLNLHYNNINTLKCKNKSRILQNPPVINIIDNQVSRYIVYSIKC